MSDQKQHQMDFNVTVPVNYFYGDNAAYNTSALDKNIMTITSEIINFPEDVRGDLLSLVKSVKKLVHPKT